MSPRFCSNPPVTFHLAQSKSQTLAVKGVNNSVLCYLSVSSPRTVPSLRTLQSHCPLAFLNHTADVPGKSLCHRQLPSLRRLENASFSGLWVEQLSLRPQRLPRCLLDPTLGFSNAAACAAVQRVWRQRLRFCQQRHHSAQIRTRSCCPWAPGAARPGRGRD